MTLLVNCDSARGNGIRNCNGRIRCLDLVGHCCSGYSRDWYGDICRLIWQCNSHRLAGASDCLGLDYEPAGDVPHGITDIFLPLCSELSCRRQGRIRKTLMLQLSMALGGEPVWHRPCYKYLAAQRRPKSQRSGRRKVWCSRNASSRLTLRQVMESTARDRA